MQRAKKNMVVHVSFYFSTTCLPLYSPQEHILCANLYSPQFGQRVNVGGTNL